MDAQARRRPRGVGVCLCGCDWCSSIPQQTGTFDTESCIVTSESNSVERELWPI